MLTLPCCYAAPLMWSANNRGQEETPLFTHPTKGASAYETRHRPAEKPSKSSSQLLIQGLVLGAFQDLPFSDINPTCVRLPCPFFVCLCTFSCLCDAERVSRLCVFKSAVHVCVLFGCQPQDATFAFDCTAFKPIVDAINKRREAKESFIVLYLSLNDSTKIKVFLHSK